MAQYACKCGAGTYDRVEKWREHYDADKPQWQRDRLAYAKLHDMIIVHETAYVSQHNGPVVLPELQQLEKDARDLDVQITSLEYKRDVIQKRIDQIVRENAPRTARTVTVVEEIDNRPNKQGTRAGEMVIEGLRKASPEKTYEMIYLGKSMNDKVKIVEKIRA